MYTKLATLEKKYGKYAVKNLSLYLVIAQVIGNIIYYTNPVWLNYISMNPYAILHGQIWRLVTWTIIPMSIGNNLFFTLIILFVFYNFGSNLERTMGTFTYNLYIFSGMIFTAIGAFVMMLYIYLFQYELITTPGLAELVFIQLGMSFSTFYVYMSIFLAIAIYIPDMMILLMFVLPVKMKYVAIVYGIILALSFFQGNVYNRIVIAASLLNFLLLFLSSRNVKRVMPKETIRRAAYQREQTKAKRAVRHKCAVCGVTDEDAPERQFRYCSKCHGNYEYCDEHLYTHAHVAEIKLKPPPT
ncbi:MAG: rhomboid family intramembrane serine protease [Lachnospiraceae bacterium]|jgi:hypothetical protein|nr:rhomboid family intramembrane serine protease [Lachnospiraceae bacterium]